MPKPSTLAELPAAYRRLAALAALVEIIADDGNVGLADRMGGELALVVDELWRAGQTEHIAIDAHEHDQPLWCKGAHLDDVRRMVGTDAAPAPRRFEFGPRDSRPADNHNLARATDET